MSATTDAVISELNNRKERGEAFIQRCIYAVNNDVNVPVGQEELRPIDCALIVRYVDNLHGDVLRDFMTVEPESMLRIVREYIFSQE